MVSAVADVVEPEMQTLTVVNSNNTSETASFTMPSGYTFEQFVGSEYDTSGGKFTFYTQEFVVYDGHGLRISSDEYSAKVEIDIVASGTFYYAGESATTYQLSGTWVFNPTINRPSVDIFNKNGYYGVNFTAVSTNSKTNYQTVCDYFYYSESSDFIDYLYVHDVTDVDNNGSFTGVTPIYKFSNKALMNEHTGEIIFDGIQTVSKEFYEWFTANAVKQS